MDDSLISFHLFSLLLLWHLPSYQLGVLTVEEVESGSGSGRGAA